MSEKKTFRVKSQGDTGGVGELKPKKLVKQKQTSRSKAPLVGVGGGRRQMTTLLRLPSLRLPGGDEGRL